MSIACSLVGHRPSAESIRNDGHHFSRCTRCSSDLVETDNSWSTAPKGYRIVWRPSSPRVEEALSLLPTPRALPSPASSEAEEAAHPAEAPQPPAERRQRVERRSNARGTVPKFLNGHDRRRSNDRREGFGKRLVTRP
jgi:hypothetical protein